MVKKFSLSLLLGGSFFGNFVYKKTGIGQSLFEYLEEKKKRGNLVLVKIFLKILFLCYQFDTKRLLIEVYFSF